MSIYPELAEKHSNNETEKIAGSLAGVIVVLAIIFFALYLTRKLTSLLPFSESIVLALMISGRLMLPTGAVSSQLEKGWRANIWHGVEGNVVTGRVTITSLGTRRTRGYDQTVDLSNCIYYIEFRITQQEACASMSLLVSFLQPRFEDYIGVPATCRRQTIENESWEALTDW